MRQKQKMLFISSFLAAVVIFQFSNFSCISFADQVAPSAEKEQEDQAGGSAFMDRIIGSTFRGLARTFVAVTDINKLRASGLKSLEKMSDDKFRSKYLKVYDVLVNLPEDVKERYSITPDMTRQQAISNLKKLDKRATYKLINEVPDRVIALAFRRNFQQEKIEGQKKETIVTRVKTVWQSMLNKVRPDTKTET